MKKVISVTVLALALSSTNVYAGGIFGSGGFFNNLIPDLPDSWGIKIPQLGDIKIGGTLGKMFEENKTALQMGTAGSLVLGPIGLIAGIIVGAKTDKAKAAAQRAYDRAVAENAAKEGAYKAAAEAYPVQTATATSNYADASSFLESRGAGEETYLELEGILFEYIYCIGNAGVARDADICLLDYTDSVNAFKRRYL